MTKPKTEPRVVEDPDLVGMLGEEASVLLRLAGLPRELRLRAHRLVAVLAQHRDEARLDRRVANGRERVHRRQVILERRAQNDSVAFGDHARMSGLYLIRCGSSASAPRVSLTHSAYSS